MQESVWPRAEDEEVRRSLTCMLLMMRRQLVEDAALEKRRECRSAVCRGKALRPWGEEWQDEDVVRRDDIRQPDVTHAPSAGRGRAKREKETGMGKVPL